MSLRHSPWTLPRDESDLSHLQDELGEHHVAVIIPAKDEATTIGPVIDVLGTYRDLISELVVVDDHSVDDTATIAREHGARVVANAGTPGKGQALRAGVDATSADLVVFLDADVLSPDGSYVPRLIAPLLRHPSLHLIKGYYERPFHHMASGGGRVNELAARPILSLLYPGLGEVRQPLAGETALRRPVLTTLSLADGYAIEIALLIDVAQSWGVDSIGQVDLGVRRHRNRPLEELRPMAVDVIRTALERRQLPYLPTSGPNTTTTSSAEEP